MEIVVFAILAIVGGFFLIKCYNRIDSALFGKGNPSYHPSGRGVVWFSMIMGALVGSIFLYNQMVDSNERLVTVYYYTAVSLLVIVVAIALLYVITGSGSMAEVIGKSLFLPVCCIVAFGVGIAAAFIVFLVAVIYLISIATKSAMEADKKSTIRTKSDLIGYGGMKLKRLSGDIFENSEGARFRKEGNRVYEIPRDEW